MKHSPVKVGDCFGRLTVEASLGVILNSAGTKGHTRFICLCVCGNRKEVRGSHLTSGGITSCGCRRREQLLTHGCYGTLAHSSWASVIQRCTNPNNTSYPEYGGVGITVCGRWRVFENFLADMGERPLGTSIERRIGTGNYTPENCYWATPEQQGANLKSNYLITYDGRTQHIAAWARETGLKAGTLQWRIAQGQSAQKALTTPPMSAREASQLGLKARYGY